jgi:hypothetical protein
LGGGWAAWPSPAVVGSRRKGFGMFRFAVALVTCGLLFAATALPASAQNLPMLPEAQKAEMMKLMLVNVSGKVAGVQGPQIALKTAANEEYIVHLFSNVSTLAVTGTAKRDALKPGVFVRFTVAEIDKKGNASGDITDLSIFTPSPDIIQAVLSDDVTGEKGPYLVTGRVTSMPKKGRGTILAGDKKVKVEFPEDLEIKVEVRDHTIAQVGDDILVTGFLAKPPLNMQNQAQTAEVVGETVEIKLLEPVTGAKKKKTPASANSAAN